jgi:hypothetical protein
MNFLAVDLERDAAAGMRGAAGHQDRGGEGDHFHGSLHQGFETLDATLGGLRGSFRDGGHMKATLLRDAGRAAL